ncbi:unnamed protein product [Ectocarpus sp. 8 AP-2014]
MAPPDTVAGVLLNPPFPLSAAGGGGGSGGPGSGFGAMGELVRLAWPLVNTTLTEEGPLTVLAPMDAAFDIAIAAGDLPPRPWYEVNSTSSSSSSPSLGAWVFQCVDGTGVGHDCGTSPRPSNTYALNGAHLCAVHAVDRVMFPADPSTDLAAILDGTPSLSRFAALLREHGLLAPPSPSSPSSSSFFSAAAAGTRPATLTLGDSEVVVGGSQKQKDERGGGGGGGGHRVSEGSRAPFLTVFAPTNAALARLERERPWLFRNSTAAAAVVGDAGGKEAAGERGVGDADDWSPVRELLAYHLVPGAALFSRYFNESSPPTRTLALGGTAPVAATFITAPASSAYGRLPSRAATVGGGREKGGCPERARTAPVVPSA